MTKLYYVTAYHWDNNEWWRFAITADSEEAAIGAFREGYGDLRFTRVNARYVCPTTTEVFDEL